MKFILLSLFMLFFSLGSHACTLCNSKQAANVRTLVFGDDFYKNLFFTVLPFIAFAGIIFGIHKSSKPIKS